jgi:hypothetical protein
MDQGERLLGEVATADQPGWSLFVTAVRHDGCWHLLENGFVYP